jgi:hypothetical protein
MNKQEKRIKLNRELERVKLEIMKSRGNIDAKLVEKYSRLVDKLIRL